MTQSNKTTWSLAFDIKDAQKREKEISQKIALLQGSLEALRARRAADEQALLKKLKKSGGVLVVDHFAFWAPSDDRLEIAPTHTAYDVDDLCAPRPPATELIEGPESFADACVAEMSAV